MALVAGLIKPGGDLEAASTPFLEVLPPLSDFLDFSPARFMLFLIDLDGGGVLVAVGVAELTFLAECWATLVGCEHVSRIGNCNEGEGECIRMSGNMSLGYWGGSDTLWRDQQTKKLTDRMMLEELRYNV